MKYLLTRGQGKRCYEYNGTKFNSPWKVKEAESGKVYDTYEDYKKATAPKPKPKAVKKTAVVKKD